MGAPRGSLPGAAPIEVVLARNDRAVVAVTKFGAYPEGFEFELIVLVGDREEELDPMVMGYMRHGRRGDREEMLRFGMQFADGSKVTNQPGSRPFPPGGGDGPPSGPVLQQRGGGGGDGEWRQDYWVWPLPPPGPLTLACEWPGAGIPLRVVEVDAQPLIEAAGRAQQIFPATGVAGGGIVQLVQVEAEED